MYVWKVHIYKKILINVILSFILWFFLWKILIFTYLFIKSCSKLLPIKKYQVRDKWFVWWSTQFFLFLFFLSNEYTVLGEWQTQFGIIEKGKELHALWVGMGIFCVSRQIAGKWIVGLVAFACLSVCDWTFIP